MGAYASDTNYPWLNVIQFPFATREFDTGEGWMSYVDQGHGRPIVFLHGNPTWAYLYRQFLGELSPFYRCVAPDMLGYGMSDKPRKVDYSPQAQAKRFGALMDYLKLDDITLVVQCIGGPIGLSWAMDNPDRVRDVVVFNSWLWPLNDNLAVRKVWHLVDNPINRIYYRILPASPTFILPALFADRHRISRQSQVQYLEPFRMYRDRLGVYASVESLIRDRKWYASLWERRELLAKKRALLMWGSKDPMHGLKSFEKFESVFDHSESRVFDQCGRYIPEEEPKTAIEEMRWFLMSHSLTASAL